MKIIIVLIILALISPAFGSCEETLSDLSQGMNTFTRRFNNPIELYRVFENFRAFEYFVQ